jgi:hypothetical protein
MALGGSQPEGQRLILMAHAPIGKQAIHGPRQSRADCYDRIAPQDRCFGANCYPAVLRFFPAEIGVRQDGRTM